MYDRLRPLSYAGADVVLIGFSVAQPDSLRSAAERWIPEVQAFCEGLPYLLVALKTDLRNDQATIDELAAAAGGGQHPVTTAEVSPQH